MHREEFDAVMLVPRITKIAMLCRFDEEAYALRDVIRTVIPAGATRCRLDEQTCWSYEF
jgi:hypothetical protein